jgi:hypothetical protein
MGDVRPARRFDVVRSEMWMWIWRMDGRERGEERRGEESKAYLLCRDVGQCLRWEMLYSLGSVGDKNRCECRCGE